MPPEMLPLQRSRAGGRRSAACVRAGAGRPRSRGLAGIVAVALGICGCGSGTANDTGSVLTMRVGEYYVSPESVRTPAGEVRMRLRNDGVLVHEVAIANSAGKIVARSGAVFPGRTASTAAFRLAPGTYRVYDPGANYADLGAYGSLTVSAPSSASAG